MAQLVLTNKPANPSLSLGTPVLRSAGVALAATAFIAVCAHISLPLFFTPVPLTLQPFAVLLVGLLLRPRAAFAALALYLLEGAAGLPVFTPHGPGGVMQLLGPTGGYLLSYPLASTLVAWLRRQGAQNFLRATWAAAAGNAVILLLGAVWFAALAHPAAHTILMQAILPFLPGDALKVVTAAAIATSIQSLRTRKDRVVSAN